MKDLVNISVAKVFDKKIIIKKYVQNKVWINYVK